MTGRYLTSSSALKISITFCEQAMKNDFGNEMLRCPDCKSDRVVVTAEQMIMANTGKLYCHSVKPHDTDSKAECLDCGWEGVRSQL